MNTKKEKLLSDTYNKWMHTGLYDLPLDGANDFVDPKIMGYGSAIDEKVLSISDYRELINRQREQAVGLEMSFEITPVFRSISNKKNSAIFVDEIKVSIILKEGKQELFLRMTTILEYIDSKWIVVHWHGSMPTETTAETDAWLVNEWQRKNEKLQKLVDEKTSELLNKNKELEIETALEKVRSSALAMKEPADMLEVCQIISEQLNTLKVKEIRNVQTAIIYESKGTYHNYEFYSKHNKTFITEVDYKTHKLQNLFANQMLNGAEELFTRTFRDKEVKDWYAYQKTTNQFADPFLETAESLNYYWYSLGPVALGMSTYIPLNEQEINLFKRFRNVFELAYRRFTDIELALAQAREAKIEAALEKVRSAAMSMNKPDDLLNVCEVLFTEFHKLGFDEMRNAMINIHNDEKETFINYDYSDEIGKSINHLTYNIHPVIAKQIKQIRSANDAFSETSFTGKDLEEWKKFRQKIGEKDDPRINNLSALYYYFYSIGTGSIGISTFNPIGEEKLTLLKRFRNVFSLSYQRYLDIALAEAQAREAQIEAALERVRAKAMAMQKPGELVEVAQLLRKEMGLLGVEELETSSIYIYEEVSGTTVCWYAIQDIRSNEKKLVKDQMTIRLNDTYVGREMLKFYDSKNQKTSIVMQGENRKEWINYCADHSKVLQGYYGDVIPERTYHLVKFPNGFMGAASPGDISAESWDLLSRATSVFSLAYTRFSDLQLAEAQSKEAQIELALERVRARTMAMQRSEELAETAYVLFQQFKELDKAPKMITIGIMKEEESVIEFWVTDWGGGGAKVNRKFNASIDEPVLLNKIFTAWKEQKKSITIELTGKELQDWINYRVALSGIPDDKDYSNSRGIIIAGIFSKGILSMSTYESVSSETSLLLERFAGVFDGTYTRFLDLQKAEAQAREAKIEASLERVRAVAMSMLKSDELLKVCESVFYELRLLGFNETDLRNTQIVINDDEIEIYNGYQYSDYTGGEIAEVPYDMHPIIRMLNDKLKQSTDAFADIEISGEAMDDWKAFVKSFPQKPDEKLNGASELHYYFYSVGIGALGISSFKSLPEEKLQILQRLRNVFNLSYQRYVDISQAEAQATEAQIELALERVRARTMGMQKSEELQQVIRVVYEQFVHLNVLVEHAGFIMDYKARDDMHIWLADNHAVPTEITIPYFDSPHWNSFIEAKEKGIDFFANHLTFEEKNKFYQDLFKLFPVPDEAKEYYFGCPGLAGSTVLLDNVGLYIENFSGISYSDEENDTLMRFGKVFQQTYTRFLDLQKAEAQAREAQIEAVLERVRSRTMAMQKSEDMAKTASEMFRQIQTLGMHPWGCGFNIFDKDEKAVTQYMSLADGGISPPFRTPLTEDPFFISIYEARQRKEELLVMESSGESLAETYRYMFGLPGSKEIFGDLENSGFEMPKYQITHCAYFSQGYLVFITYEQVPEAHDIFKRFAKVFDQTYTRFLDLQKAEAQARESQIQLALERVRARTMAMQHSDELADASFLLDSQVRSLGIKTRGCAFNIYDDNESTEWFSSEAGTMPTYKTPRENIFLRYYEAGQSGKTMHIEEFEGETCITHYDYLCTLPVMGDALKKMKESGGSFPVKQIDHVIYFKYGYLLFITLDHVPEAHDIFKSFAKVFEQTYTRFLDLKKAEVQAREAIKQASLDRVRGEIASMRTAEDLNRITPIIWGELKTLEVPFIRCGVFIVDDAREKVHVYLSTPDGHSLGVLNLSFDANELTSKTVQNWRKKTVYTEHWSKDQFINWMKSMIEIGQIPNNKSYQGSDNPPESLNLHFIPFAQGMMYVGNTTPLTDGKIQLVKSLADSFSLAYTRYEDFKNLEDAKNRVEVTLSELKSAQAQLVQAEKLASLGQLTAGIAHEIKNPLNFVNNFSEISNELIDEMKIELQNNNKEEAMAIADDIKQNLEKINQHGKRADSIVKGMLLHSRGSSGEKTLTDINDLLDQYVNLAYHGLRAQDKEFNITIQKDFDETLEKINVMPQDISRVFLNIINNACYAANEKKLKLGDAFSPLLKVSTKNLKDKIEIRIRDNGNGIPQSIKKSIFNPFFTTKPTGEGTGLGLSLSYDIITKVHNGEIIFETKENEFTEFTITIPST